MFVLESIFHVSSFLSQIHNLYYLYNKLNYNTTVPIKSNMAAQEVFRKHIFSRQLWTTPHLWLNAVQEEAARLAFSKPFLLIQGPPGNCLANIFVALVVN